MTFHDSAEPDEGAVTDLLRQLLEDENERHLSYAQLERLVDRQSSPADEAVAESHLAECPSCRADVAHLRQIAAQVRGETRTTVVPFKSRTQWKWIPRAGWAAIAAAALVAAVVWWPSTSPIRLADGGHRIVIHANGTVRGLESLAPDARAAVESALRVGHLETPAEFNDPRDRAGTLLGGSSTPQEILLSPLGVVIDDRPVFEWRGDGTAGEYSVHVFDGRGDEVSQSWVLRERRWQPDTPLPRGQVFTWQVVAADSGRERVFPAPPAHEARFRVLETAAVQQLDLARRSSGASHLVMGVLYARAGLFGDARRELAALSADNPKADLPRTLLASLPPES
jgi:hypothetical protein